MNLFHPDPLPPEGTERCETLLERPGLRVERIVSNRHYGSHWYDQREDELVLLLRGDCTLEFERGAQLPSGAPAELTAPLTALLGRAAFPPQPPVRPAAPPEGPLLALTPGEPLLLPAYLRHRVRSAGLHRPAGFLCLFFEAQA